MFEHFWSTWPKGKKFGKGAALKAWKKLNPNTGLAEQIIKAVEAQKAWRQRVEKANALLPRWQQTFLPHWKHPATWLNQECWLDDIPDALGEAKRSEKIVCHDCGGEFKARYCGVPYCLRCYDKHAHPELRSA